MEQQSLTDISSNEVKILQPKVVLFVGVTHTAEIQQYRRKTWAGENEVLQL